MCLLRGPGPFKSQGLVGGLAPFKGPGALYGAMCLLRGPGPFKGPGASRGPGAF